MNDDVLRYQLAGSLGVNPGTLTCSGERIDGFRKGWAKAMFNGEKAHYFKRHDLERCAESCCGVISPVGYLHGEGNWPRCKRCERMIA